MLQINLPYMYFQNLEYYHNIYLWSILLALQTILYYVQEYHFY